MKNRVYVDGIKKGIDVQTLKDKIEVVFLKATNNLEWLNEGDVVLLKPAVNSSNRYPATSHPFVIEVLTKILKDKKAKVVVGDCASVNEVQYNKKGIIKGSTSKAYLKSGMGNSTVNFIGFEENGWNDFYRTSKAYSWPKGFYITKEVRKVDHIINLPIISTNLATGVSLGYKNLIGLLRFDSQLELYDGNFYKKFIRKNHVAYNKNKKSIYEKTVEISGEIDSKLRLTMFVATHLMFSGIRVMIDVPEEGLIIASPNLLVADIFAFTYLKYRYLKIKDEQGKSFRFFNKGLDINSIYANEFIKYGLRYTGFNQKVKVKYSDVLKDDIKEYNKIIRN